MKVGTDSIMLGAWVLFESPKSVLDIGTGSGVIALMMAQRFPDASITAVEIVPEAVSQAQQNFDDSPWSERLRMVEADICKLQKLEAFDLIVTNPPYFEDGKLPQDEGRRTARHTGSLSHGQLVDCVDRLLSDDGQFAVVLPAESQLRFRQICEQVGLHCSGLCLVRPGPGAVAKRVLMQFGRSVVENGPSESLVVELSRHKYSLEFKQLTTDFYLKH